MKALQQYTDKLINAVVALEFAALLYICIVVCYGSITDYREYITRRIESVPRIGRIETGISKIEMLSRFGSANYMEIYHDKKYKTDVTKFYYRIDPDDTLFLMFVYSWSTGMIIDFDMVRGDKDWYYWNYGSSLHNYWMA